MATRYLGLPAIGAYFGFTRQAAQYWYKKLPGFPEPDAWIMSGATWTGGATITADGELTGAGEEDGTPAWLPERIGEIIRLLDARPGRGAGGGRPRKTDQD